MDGISVDSAHRDYMSDQSGKKQQTKDTRNYELAYCFVA